MPFIRVEILKGRTLDQRRAFARRVTEAAVETLGTTPEKVRITFQELDPTELSRAGVLASDVGREPSAGAA
ncbi:MAG: 4-oxalocrotonate tautomerase [Chloroflexota bacterium]|jgi:4-oxalocrotonate tautomerase|nr:4-oxalocrotonate tautomerase [Chloroflexota bacterium]